MTGVHHRWKGTFAGFAVGTLLGCADGAAPVAPSNTRPALAANTEGSLAVVSVVGLEPLVGAPVNASSSAADINDLGLVVGSSRAPNGEIHAVIWNPSVSPFPFDLGTLPGGTSSAATAINSAGTVIVGSASSVNLDQRVVRWVFANGGWTIQDLGLPSGNVGAEATDITDDGSIVGTTHNGTEARGFIWRNGVITDLGAAGIQAASALNGSGQIVGWNYVGHAVLRTESGGTMELGTLGGPTSRAHGINESGEVVGTAATTASGDRAFLWTSRNGMVPLGTLGGSAAAYAINRAGYIVGESFTPANQRHPVLWAKGKTLDVGVLPGYADAIALAINDQKQIVGFSELGTVRATLWTIK